MVFISKSIMNSYRTCPQRYKLLYVDKIETTTSDAMQRGLDFHDFVNRFYDHVSSGSNGELLIDPLFVKESLDACIPEAQPYITNFINFEYKRWDICKQQKDAMKYFMPVMREEKIKNIGLELVGVVDRVDRKFNGNYLVVEFKTGKFDQRAWKLTELRQELAFYKLLLESSSLITKPVEDFVVFYPRTNDVWTETFKTVTLNAFKKNLDIVRRGIEGKDFPCNISVFCRYCEASGRCPMTIANDVPKIAGQYVRDEE
jgi:RecB family exonuclease